MNRFSGTVIPAPTSICPERNAFGHTEYLASWEFPFACMNVLITRAVDGSFRPERVTFYANTVGDNIERREDYPSDGAFIECAILNVQARFK